MTATALVSIGKPSRRSGPLVRTLGRHADTGPGTDRTPVNHWDAALTAGSASRNWRQIPRLFAVTGMTVGHAA
jgi:hypothetical protein